MKELFFIFVIILLIINHFLAKYLEKAANKAPSGIYNEAMVILLILECLCIGFASIFVRIYDR